MLLFVLTEQSELERPKRRGYTSCPGKTVCYGVPNIQESYGVKECK